MGVLQLLRPGQWDEENQERTRWNFQRLNDLIGAVLKDSDGFGFTVAGIGVRFGSNTLAFAASTNSGPKTITHALGKTPAVIFVTNADTAGSFGGIASYTTAAKTTTQFDVYGRTPTATTATLAIYWIAVG